MTPNLRSFETREEWLIARAGAVGGSEAPALFGVSPFTSPYKLWSEKVGLIPAEEPDPDLVFWGSNLEDAIARGYSRARPGHEVVNPGAFTIWQDPARPAMAATLDRLIKSPEKGTPGNLQIKNTGWYMEHNWDEGAPLGVVVQVQHEMACSGLDWGVAAVLIGGNNFKWFEIERDEEFIGELGIQCELFMKRVRERTPPPVDGHKHTTAALKRMHPRDTGETIELPTAALDWDTEYASISEEIAAVKAKLKALETKKETVEQQFREAMGPAASGIILNPPGAVTIEWSLKTTDRAGFTVQPTSYRTLRRKVRK